MTELSFAYNKAIQDCVSSVTEGCKYLKIQHSTALHDVDISSPECLSDYDAWHPSRLGHRKLAEAAHTVVEPYLRRCQ